MIIMSDIIANRLTEWKKGKRMSPSFFPTYALSTEK